jgi:hypothetical protein
VKKQIFPLPAMAYYLYRRSFINRIKSNKNQSSTSVRKPASGTKTPSDHLKISYELLLTIWIRIKKAVLSFGRE